MARRKSTQTESERMHRLGLADPRTGRERLAGLVGRAAASKVAKKQNRRYDDSPTTRAKNIREVDEDRKRRGVTSSRPAKKAAKKSTRRR